MDNQIASGLPSHTEHEIFKKQAAGHGGVVSFYIKDATIKHSEKFLSSLQIFALAESLGGFESLAELPLVLTLTRLCPT